jgi:hypothetical protein
MKDLMGMMKQAQQLQARIQKMQQELAALEVEGQAGGGLVRLTMSGKGDIVRLKIDPTLLKPDEAEIVEDLVLAAARDAKSKAEAAAQERMAEVTGGLPLPPGLKLW